MEVRRISILICFYFTDLQLFFTRCFIFTFLLFTCLSRGFERIFLLYICSWIIFHEFSCNIWCFLGVLRSCCTSKNYCISAFILFWTLTYSIPCFYTSFSVFFSYYIYCLNTLAQVQSKNVIALRT